MSVRFQKIKYYYVVMIQDKTFSSLYALLTLDSWEQEFRDMDDHKDIALMKD